MMFLSILSFLKKIMYLNLYVSYGFWVCSYTEKELPYSEKWKKKSLMVSYNIFIFKHLIHLEIYFDAKHEV